MEKIARDKSEIMSRIQYSIKNKKFHDFVTKKNLHTTFLLMIL